MRFWIAVVALSFTVAAAPSVSEAFTKVSDRDSFVDLTSGKLLTRFGIKLIVTPDGQIQGRGFGRAVKGAWAWRQGYFCRSLFWGERNLGDNCQEVKISGDTLRFTSDLGSGPFADLELE